MVKLMTYLKALIALLFPAISMAVCTVYDSNNIQIMSLHDGVFYLLNNSSQCPSNVIEFNELIESAGLQHKPSMVANRGRNNPTLGSFSIFEGVSGKIVVNKIEIKEGELFYGH
jgi:hypothetical protein